MPPRITRKKKCGEPCIVQGTIGWCEACRAHVPLPCVACRARATLAKVRRGNREPRQDLVLRLEGEDLKRYKAYRAIRGLSG